MSVRVSSLKKSSRTRGLVVEIDDDAISKLILGDCGYCGKRSEVGDFNGVDRLDAKEGYVPGNVVSCCSVCNYAKGSMDPSSFVAHCVEVAAHPNAATLADSYEGEMCLSPIARRS